MAVTASNTSDAIPIGSLQAPMSSSPLGSPAVRLTMKSTHGTTETASTPVHHSVGDITRDSVARATHATISAMNR